MDPKRSSCILYLCEHLLSGDLSENARCPEDGNARSAGNHFLEEFKTFGDQTGAGVRQARYVSSRSRQAHRVPIANRVTYEGANDWYGRSGLLDRSEPHRTRRNYQVKIKTCQFGGQIWKPGELTLRIAVFNYKVSALHITKFTQPFEERIV